MAIQPTAQLPLRSPYRSTSDDVSPVASLSVWPFARDLIDARDIGQLATIVFTPDAAPGGALRRAMKWVVGGLHGWRQRMRDRQQISSFDDYLLRDVGLTRQDVQRF